MDICFWEEVDTGDYYESGCNRNGFQFNYGTPYDNDFMFCPFCGKTLKIKEPIFDEEDTEQLLQPARSCGGVSERRKRMIACEDCGNDDGQRMCMGICAVCGGEIIEVDEDGERVDE